ncbi:MAG TPA: hypothetical protein VE083_03260 [Terriglobales bacterium]|nr:hypothetical protein [Terriglobales bacterium]
MTNVDWSLVEVAAQLLKRDERDAVLGDLVEAGGESAWQGLLDVLGLVIRRQALLWRSWRPWLAAFGLALPASLLLMGFSLSVSWTYQHFIDPKVPQANGLMVGPGLWVLACRVFLLIGWSWTGGFVVGSVSRQTLWVSIASGCFPCLFCLARFREESLSRLCLLLFLAPAILGVRQGVRIIRIKMGSAIVLAMAVTALVIPARSGMGPWMLNWGLIWPAWYMVATARKPG